MPRLSKIGAAALAAFGWTGLQTVSASYLVVAGGGGGGTGNGGGGGGGGAGGYRTGTSTLNPTLSYTVTVGAGGTGGVTSTTSASAGGDSVFNAITSTGGGKGGGNAGGNAGGSGGSGGGAGNATPTASGGSGNTPSTSPSQGNNGGASGTTPQAGAGGGGGSSAVGGDGSSSATGNGGNGTANSISGTSVTYAGGGGGGNGYNNGSFNGTPGTGGTGGGGNGGQNGSAGTANLGGGGGGGNFGTGSGNGGNGGSGVVIISYPAPQQFGGGIVTTSGSNVIHTFTTSGTLSPLSSLTASYLIVAGGGGGGSSTSGTGGSGAGGAGGLLSGSGLTIDSNSVYVVTVGAGGGVASNAVGTQGTNSSFSAYATVAVGGGYGGKQSAGGSGGSGGGAGYATYAGGTGTSGQGNAGGNTTISVGGGAGGGGAGAAGSNATTVDGSSGGVGVSSSISGTSTYYAGGGGGGAWSAGSPGSGGNGGGGGGGTNAAVAGVSGTANTGGGGGGGGGTYSVSGGSGGQGGSGIVIISYAGSTQQMAGGTVTISGGNVIHTFTSSGYLTPIKYVNNSLRFRSSASAYLNRTPATASNRKTWTWSGWFKRGALGTGQVLFKGGTTGVNGWSSLVMLQFTTADVLRVNSNNDLFLVTSQVFRDPSAWYHIVLLCDTTQATATNRLRLFVNGSEITSFSTDGRSTYISQNSDSAIDNTVSHEMGRNGTDGNYLDGYLTEVNFIDGQALTPNSFGTFNSYGVWQPITYGGSYGTNGFYLNFSDNSNNTAATIGKDYSGNGNNWTPNNISVTAGATYDSMTDVPTLTSATAANYCVFNPLAAGTNITVSNGNLQATASSVSNSLLKGTIGVSSGKWYWEVTLSAGTSAWAASIIKDTAALSIGSSGDTYSYSDDGNKYNAGTSTSYGNTYTTNDLVSVAFDADNGKVFFGKNGTWQASGDPVAGTNAAFTGITGTYMPNVLLNSATGIANFGQRPFSYTPPTGYVALNTYNLPTSTITNGAAYMAATTYTGTGSSLTIANTVGSTSFQPDFVWVKGRSGATDHALYDSVRGTTKDLASNTTAAETTQSTGLTAFGSTGFTVGALAKMNTSSATYVGWQWYTNGGTSSSNTNGSITSTVSANTTAGFSVVTYTGTGANATVGHGLGVAPQMVIVKSRSLATGWNVYHQYANASPASGVMTLQATDAFFANSAWNSTVPTSSVFSIGPTGYGVNNSGATYVAYCFAAVAGYSAFGSYTGNGSSDGPFVFLGFRPRFVFWKNVSTTGDWQMKDSSRSTYNVTSANLYANLSNAENSAGDVDFLSNGFKIRSAGTDVNGSGNTIIYAAFAENPFKYANAR
jgi:hypothetical protein